MTSEQRSRTMRSVKSQDTEPELTVRRLLHKMGFRYRLHRKDLPGKPDIVFASRKKVIFIHGCFWHGHYCKRGGRRPKTNKEYWQSKIERNVQRFDKQIKELAEEEWSVLTIWECQLKDTEVLKDSLIRFLQD